MLRKIRIGISVVLFALITFYFLDFANILPNSFHRLAHIQFVPAVLSLSIGILIVLIALTLLFGPPPGFMPFPYYRPTIYLPTKILPPCFLPERMLFVAEFHKKTAQQPTLLSKNVCTWLFSLFFYLSTDAMINKPHFL